VILLVVQVLLVLATALAVGFLGGWAAWTFIKRVFDAGARAKALDGAGE
jgi:hypothetical protein